MDIYKRMALQPRMYSYRSEDDVRDVRLVPDDVYVEKMEHILSGVPCVGVPPEPSLLMAGVYLGKSADAENIALLRAWHIQYLLNCDGGSYIRFRRLKEHYGPGSGILGYEELPLDDSEHANARSYFERAHAFINYARSRGGRVLIYCPGVSRSGAVAISYLINQGQTLLQAVRSVKDKRRVVLSNTAFMYQLVGYARDQGRLDSDVEGIRTQNYFSPINRYRMRYSHLPMAWEL